MSSAPRRTVVALAAVALATSTSLMPSGAPASPAPPVARAASTVGYTCAVPMPVFPGLPQQYSYYLVNVAFGLSFPKQVKARQTIPAKPVKLTLTFPDDPSGGAQFLRSSAVSGTVTDLAFLTKSLDLTVSTVKLPAVTAPTGPVVFRGTGKASKFKPSSPGTVKIGAPATFVLDLKTSEGPTAFSKSLCSPLAPTTIATIKVTKPPKKK